MKFPALPRKFSLGWFLVSLVASPIVFGVNGYDDPPSPVGIFEHAELVNSFGAGDLTNAGYSFQDRQPLASFEAPDGTLWQVVGYISLNRLPVVQWRFRAPESEVWSLWARVGLDADVLPPPGSNWHGYMSVGIDTAGHVHLIYDGRSGSGFRYHRSDTPIHQGWTGGLVNRSNDGIPGWSANSNSTYWRFSKHPETGVMTLAMRRSGSGHALFYLDAETQTWSAFPGTRPSDGRLFNNDGLFAHYVAHDVVFRGDDVFVGYSERQAGGATTNEDLSVVKYNAATGEWTRLDGTVLQTPIGRGQGTVIDPSKTDSMLDHRWDMMTDGQGRVHGFYRRLAHDPDNVPPGETNSLQIFHFWIDEHDNVHGPQPVTHFTDYTEFWQNTGSTGVALSQARSFYVGETVYLAWQERDSGQQVRAMAARHPFTVWSDPVVIDDTNLRNSDPEFERWAWDSRGEIWLAATPFATNTSAGLPVTVRQIPVDNLPALAALPFGDWIAGTTVPENQRAPTDRNGSLQMQNFESYAIGVDPMSATWEDLMRIFPPTGDQPRVRFFRNPLAANLLIEFEYSLDLEDWAALAPETLQVLHRETNRERVEAVFPEDSSPLLFLRMIYRSNGE